MTLTYDDVVNAFLSKITEFELVQLSEDERDNVVSGYMKRTIASFNRICEYDLSTMDDDLKTFSVEIDDADVDEILDIVSEGMIVQWLKPYTYKQELLENVLNTSDYSTYSPAELLMRVGNAYTKAQNDYTQMVREYSYNHGDLTDLHI